MALGGKKKSPASKGGKKENKYVNIASVLEGEKPNDDGSDNLYIKASSFKGRLIWQEFGGEDGDDENDSKFWEIKSAFIGTPHEKSPDFVKQTLVVNLLNPKAATLLET